MTTPWGKTLTRLFVSSAWSSGTPAISEAFDEFKRAGWEEECSPDNDGYRCLTKFDADMDAVRRVAERNPGLIVTCFTLDAETKKTAVYLGIGGTWLRTVRRLSPAIGLEHWRYDPAYVLALPPSQRAAQANRQASQGDRSQSTKKPGKPADASAHAGAQEEPASGPRASTHQAGQPATVTNTLTFHGLPGEVEQARVLVLAMLSEAVQATASFKANGNENYSSGTMIFTTAGKPAFPVFNRLMAHMPGLSVSLEYDDANSGQRKVLRAVDGKIQDYPAA